MKKTKFFTLGITMLIASGLFFGCSKDGGIEQLANSSVQSQGTGGDGGSTIYASRISIQQFLFTPAKVTIMQGGIVLWTNNDEAVHTVTAAEGSFDSGDIQPGKTFSYTFNSIGDHRYYCKYHQGQAGIVEAAIK